MGVLQRQSSGPRVELLCVGTELLMGKLNTHGAYFSSLLEEGGLPLARETTVSDDPTEMEWLFRETWKRAQVIVVTGGLGPTFDDLTRDVWAKVCGRKLVLRPEILAVIAERFRRRGTPMPPANRRQAYLIEGARPLANAHGTAPGQLLEVRGKTLVLLPGPGREMKPMVEQHIVPFLLKNYSPGPRRTKIWRLFGMPESAVDQQLRGMLTSKGGLSWGILAQDGVVDVKMTVSGSDVKKVEKTLAEWNVRMLKKFGVVIFGNQGETLESVVGGLLRGADIGCGRILYGRRAGAKNHIGSRKFRVFLGRGGDLRQRGQGEFGWGEKRDVAAFRSGFSGNRHGHGRKSAQKIPNRLRSVDHGHRRPCGWNR
ncbi:MAG: hypothetical protein IPN90_00180 [Elusimicrobia bacterium]|nr:hypothetical protein [Elusimicrobiota bacterium]